MLRVSDRRQEPRFDRSLVVEPLVASELRVRVRLNPLQFSRGAIELVVTVVPDVAW